MHVFNQMVFSVALSMSVGCMPRNVPAGCPVDNNYFIVGIEANGQCSPARLNECAPDANTAYERDRAQYMPTAKVLVCHDLDVSPDALCSLSTGEIKPVPTGCTTFGPSE